MSGMPPEYGPIETEWWWTCPTLRWFRVKGWQPRGELWTPNRVVGRALHAGIATYMPAQDPAKAVNMALAVLRQGYENNDEWPLASLERIVTRGLVESLNTTVKTWVETEQFVSAEVPIGGGRLDYVTRTAEGLIVTDTKSTMSLKAEYVPDRLSQAEYDWQLWDSAWRAAAYYQEPVKWRRRHLIVLSPRCKAFVQPFPVTETALMNWEISARWAWMHMAEESTLPANVVPQRLEACRGRYGPCAFAEACHVYHRDEKAMQALYVKVTS